MKDQTYYLGIDLGTSAAKAVLRNAAGESRKAKCPYTANTPDGWMAAVETLIRELKSQTEGRIAAVGFSSQVGTYIIDGNEVISWQSDAGLAELEEIKQAIPQDEFLREIAMPHPDLISYPLPRLLYIQRRFGKEHEVLMPKELLIRALTGQTVTDIFSMRGLANPNTVRYAESILQKLGIETALPPLRRPTDLAGYVTAEAAERFGLDENTPVYLGCNDFFAGLLGMGIHTVGDCFELSGTSSHLGYLAETVNRSAFVSGEYFQGRCTYGPTKSSGPACDLAIREFGIDGIDLHAVLAEKPPVFLPYLKGERAPIFDEQARGVFFGLNEKTDRKALAYAALEGVVFSLYDIAQSMHMPAPKRLVCGGGSAKNPLMNTLRATLYDCDVIGVEENDTSALGACLLAMTGDGVYPTIDEAIDAHVRHTAPTHPDPTLRETLQKRFALYRRLYGDLKESFQIFTQI